MGQPRPLFVLFKHNLYRKNCMLQRDLNSDRPSRRQPHWPLDFHHSSRSYAHSFVCKILSFEKTEKEARNGRKKFFHFFLRPPIFSNSETLKSASIILSKNLVSVQHSKTLWPKKRSGSWEKLQSSRPEGELWTPLMELPSGTNAIKLFAPFDLDGLYLWASTR